MKNLISLLIFAMTITANAEKYQPIIWGSSGGSPSAQILAPQLCFKDGTCQSTHGGGGGGSPGGSSGSIQYNNSGALGGYSLTSGTVIGSDGTAGVKTIAQVQGYTSANKAGDTFTGTVVLNGNPVNPLEAATKTYVDSLVSANQQYKANVQVATTIALPAVTYNNIAGTLTAIAPGALVIDGYTTALTDRIVIKNQVSGFQNGIYTVTTEGALGVAFVLTRSTDANTGVLLQQASTKALLGVTNINHRFVQTATSVIVGTTNLVFTDLGVDSSVVAGNGLTTSGSTISVLANGSTLDVSGSGVKIATSGVTNNEVATGISYTKISSLDPIALKKSNLSASVPPTVSDDNTSGYAVGSVWVDTVHAITYFAQDVTTGAAVWGSSSVANVPTTTVYQAAGSYDYVVPSFARYLNVQVLGAGGGGQSGSTDVSTVSHISGAGGTPGGYSQGIIPANAIIPSKYTYTIPSSSLTNGATYTVSGLTFTVSGSTVSSTTGVFTVNGLPAVSGTLTRVTGSGSATIAYTSYVTPSTGSYTFAIASSSAAAGDTYSNSGTTFTVTSTISPGTSLSATASIIAPITGTLVKASGSGPASLAYSAFTRSVVVTVGAGGAGGVAVTGAATAGNGGAQGGASTFGVYFKASGGSGTTGLGAGQGIQSSNGTIQAGSTSAASGLGNPQAPTVFGGYGPAGAGIAAGWWFTVTALVTQVNTGAVYTDGSHNYTMQQCIVGATTCSATITGFTPSGGTLTYVSGTGPATVTFSAVTSGHQLGGTQSIQNVPGIVAAVTGGPVCGNGLAGNPPVITNQLYAGTSGSGGGSCLAGDGGTGGAASYGSGGGGGGASTAAFNSGAGGNGGDGMVLISAF